LYRSAASSILAYVLLFGVWLRYLSDSELDIVFLANYFLVQSMLAPSK